MKDLVILIVLVAVVYYFMTIGRRQRAREAAQWTPPPVVPARPVEQPASPVATVAESVTAVLRRQVPPRDEAPRSWFGGLPMLPDGVAWPRSVSHERPDEGERPLHFVAQVACADLPADLWGGLGPRTGWLVFFLDPNDGTPDELGSHAVIHVDELGTERAAPFDLGPVHDGVYTGGSYRWLPTERVPPTWARWPVDVVSFPNRLVEEEGRSSGTPDDFARVLYGGAPVRERLDPVRPYTAGQALAAVRVLAAQVQVEPRPVAGAGAMERLRAEGGLAELDAWPGSVDELVWRLQTERDDVRRWQHETAAQCAAVEASLARRDVDDPLAAEEWDALVAEFAGRQVTYRDVVLRRDWSRPDLTEPRLRLDEHRVVAVLAAPPSTTQQATLDWIDPARRALVPSEAVEDLAARSRHLYNNRPHRMGGYHDGVQSDAVEGPASELLLLQLATDDAMDWCWGDAGAYYFWIRSDHLASGDLSGVQMWLECH